MTPELLRSKRFLPLFVTQFLGAFNDNFFKNALLIMITYKAASGLGADAAAMVNIAAGVFILPFFLFSATAGQLADKYDRAFLTRILKVVEIVLMVLAGMAVILQSWYIALFLLFMMGTQSAFFGPIKYALLPQHLRENELIAGNAYIEGATYLAILGGTILGGLLVMQPHGEAIVAGGLIVVAVAGYLASTGIPVAAPPMPQLKVNYNFFYETWVILRDIRRQIVVFRCVLGISWFWLIGALLLSQLPMFCKDVLHTDETVVTYFLTIFSLGIGLGSLLCNRLLRGVVQTTFVPLGALGMTVFIFDLYLAHRGLSVPAATVGLAEFIHSPLCRRLSVDMLMIAVCGGIFIVPLYALMQHRADPSSMARVVAGNNIVNAVFMVAAAVAVVGALKLGYSIPHIFVGTAAINLLVGIYICRLLPDALLRSLFRGLLSFLYRVEVKNLENYQLAGERVLIIANHTSLLDGLLIAAFMPEKVTFAINTQVARKWWVRPFLSIVDAFPVDPTNPLATRALIEEIRKDCKCMIFPEGRITVTGALMKVYEGSGMIAEKSRAMVLPIRIEGAQFSKFSYLKHKLNTRWFPKITLTLLAPRRLEVDAEIKGRERRRLISRHIYDMMVEMIYHTSPIDEHIFHSLLQAEQFHGGSHKVAEDMTRKVLNYRQLIAKSYLLGNALRRSGGTERYLGLMLPNSLANVVAFWGLQAYDRIPCMINFSSGSASVIAVCTAVGIKTIFTSHQFIAKAHLEGLENELKEAGLRLVYLEEVKAEMSLGTLAGGLLRSWFRPKPKARPDEPAVVLFTSGSEGIPKAVLLSHRNLQANRAQVLSVMPITADDRIFNCLPMFHSFGLSSGTVLPMLSGIRTFFYPSPLHYRIIPELSYDFMATIIVGTDTFLAGYARMAHPYDFFSIRFAVVGAEKLKESTADLWMKKFGVRIFEGYGATETSPVISINTPMCYRAGTVGRPLPGMTCRLEPVPGVEAGGRLMLKGDNIMLGYMRHDRPQVLQAPEEGWYDTGDIVEIDHDGYVAIKGRVKRFAKVAGEMISLTAVEMAVSRLWPKFLHGVVAVPDLRKGEQLALITTNPDADTAEMVRYFKEQGLSELWVPRRIMPLKTAPLLGNGKFDYVSAQKLALEKFGGNG